MFVCFQNIPFDQRAIDILQTDLHQQNDLNWYVSIQERDIFFWNMVRHGYIEVLGQVEDMFDY